MLNLHSALLRTPISDATAAPSAGRAPTFGTDPAGFASLLRQTQVAPAPAPAPMPTAPPAAPAAPAPAASPQAAAQGTAVAATEAHAPASTNDPDNAAQPNPAAETVTHSRAPAKVAARALDGGGRPTDGADLAVLAPAAGGDTETDTPEAPADAAPTAPNGAEPLPLDPNVMQWLAGLQRTSAARFDAGGAPGTASATAGADARAMAPGVPAAALPTEAEPNDTAAPGQPRHDAVANHGRFTAAPAEQRAVESAPPLLPQPTPSTRTIDAIDAIDAIGETVASAAAFGAPMVATHATPALLAVAIATPVNAPDFAQALGLQMSVLARDAIQHAELHLNPAEMGPVSVQITIDGTQARVEFGADAAATRQAIEAGLAQLASALQDAGFTLAGGGVSQHSRRRSDGAGAGDGNGSSRGDRRERQPSEDSVARVGNAARRIVAAGGVDLYA